MKPFRKILLLLILMLGIQAVAGTSWGERMMVTAWAGTQKKGLMKENGKYYYYKNGVKQKNVWKTVASGKKRYRYYFGKTGAACAGTVKDGAKVPAVKKIGGTTYAFDTKGRMLTGVQLIGARFYVFKSNGKLNQTRTLALRKAAKYGSDAKKLKSLLKSYGVKCKKTEYFGVGCFGDGEDGMLYYPGFMVSIFKFTSGKLTVLEVYPS